MMSFLAFCRSHGLMLDSLQAGRWVRVPTDDHPRKKNGAYKWLGEVGWVQNHATMVEPAQWRDDAPSRSEADRKALNERIAAYERRQRQGWAAAATRAHELIAQSKQGPHEYLRAKGLDSYGLVHRDGALLVPMRDCSDNSLRGLQVIRWRDDEQRFEKKMLLGMRAKGAVLRIGAPSPTTWLVEGYATGLSVFAALQMLSLRHAVLVCFSDSNLVYVASITKGKRYVFADNDVSGAGERAARASGLPYCMSGTVGHDANDMHQQEGLLRVANLMLDATQYERCHVP